ncbi:MAG: hypothetical protein JXB62_22475 [Pirellulales bacterium]|nr:hypothetical protein [Pirellulales bacterium]
MRPSGTLIVLLVVATVTVDAAGLSAVVTGPWAAPHWPHAALGLLIALSLSQVGLAAIWAGLSRQPIAWRLASMVLVVALWGFSLAVILPGDSVIPRTAWTPMLLGHALMVFVPLWISRACVATAAEMAGSADSAGTGNADSAGRGAVDRSAWQFSLRHMFTWITAVAVILGMIQFGRRQGLLPPSSLIEPWDFSVILGAVHGLVALAAVWAALGRRRPVLRAVVSCLPLIAALVFYRLLAGDHERRMVLTMQCVLHAALLCGSLWVFRMAGYRLSRRSRHRSIPVRATTP